MSSEWPSTFSIFIFLPSLSTKLDLPTKFTFLLLAGILKCFLPLCIRLRTPFHRVLKRHARLLVSVVVCKTHPDEYQPRWAEDRWTTSAESAGSVSISGRAASSASFSLLFIDAKRNFRPHGAIHCSEVASCARRSAAPLPVALWSAVCNYRLLSGRKWDLDFGMIFSQHQRLSVSVELLQGLIENYNTARATSVGQPHRFVNISWIGFCKVRKRRNFSTLSFFFLLQTWPWRGKKNSESSEYGPLS